MRIERKRSDDEDAQVRLRPATRKRLRSGPQGAGNVYVIRANRVERMALFYCSTSFSSAISAVSVHFHRRSSTPTSPLLTPTTSPASAPRCGAVAIRRWPDGWRTTRGKSSAFVTGMHFVFVLRAYRGL